MNTIKRRFGSARGAELIEFALVFPLLLLVVLGIVDFGFLFQRMEVVTNAAREGARIAVLPGYSSTDVCTRALNYLKTGGMTPNPANATCTCPATGLCTNPTNPQITIDTAFSISMGAGVPPLQGKRVLVEYSSSYLFLSPIIGRFGGSLSSVPIRGVAIMRDELPSS